jgi:hypothetical protein
MFSFGPSNYVGSGESFHPTSTCTSYQQGSPLPRSILYSTRTGRADQFFLFFWKSNNYAGFRESLHLISTCTSYQQGVHYLVQSCTVLELGRQINSYSLLEGRGALFSTSNNDAGFRESFHPTSACTSCQGVHYLIQSCTVQELREGRSILILCWRVGGLFFPHQTMMLVSGSLFISLQHVFHAKESITSSNPVQY